MNPPDGPAVAVPDAAALAVRLAKLLADAARLGQGQADPAELPQLRRWWAEAVLRNQVLAVLEGESADNNPLHLAVIGGTNSGKSTVVNCLLEEDLAPVAPTVRFSQHPEAFACPEAGDEWVEGHPARLAGFECFRDRHPPRQDDEQLAAGYRRAWALWKTARGRLPAAVVWDTPDITTRPAQLYRPATLEVLALADVVVLVVTEERYADRLPVAYFQMLLEGGRRLVVLANKAPPQPAALLQAVAETLASSQQAVGGQNGPAWDGRVWSLPRLPTAAPTADDWTDVPEAEQFRSHLAEVLADRRGVRGATLGGAVRLLDQHLDELIQPLRSQVEMADEWRWFLDQQVLPGLLAQYRREYLDASRYAEFDQAMVRLMGLLRIPGISMALDRLDGAVRSVGRWTYRLARRLIWGPTSDSAAAQPAEKPIVAGCLAQLRLAADRECQRRCERTDLPIWRELSARLRASEGDRLEAIFWPAYEQYREAMQHRQQEVADAIYQALRSRPGAVRLLQGLKLSGQGVGVVLAVKSGGLNWSDWITGPAVVYLTEKLVHLIGRGALELQARRLKSQQLEAFEQFVRQQAVDLLARLPLASIDASAVREAPGWWQHVRRAVRELEATT